MHRASRRHSILAVGTRVAQAGFDAAPGDEKADDKDSEGWFGEEPMPRMALDNAPNVDMPDMPDTSAMSVARPRVIDRRARITAWFVICFGVVFVSLAVALHRAEGTAIDVRVTRAVQRIELPGLADLMLAISAIGYAPWTWFVLGGVVAVLLAGRFYREIPFILATEGAGLLVASIKLLVERPRPTDDLVRVASAVLDFSFPSGHVTSYVSLYGFLFFLVYVLFRRSWPRTALLCVLAALVGLVGVSRIYLGHHWVSDVLGGYAFGSVYLLVLIEAYRLLVVRRRPPGTRYALRRTET
jgi:membrane-associated phospholipid phosphatase